MKCQEYEGVISAVFPVLIKLHLRFAPFLTLFNRLLPDKMLKRKHKESFYPASRLPIYHLLTVSNCTLIIAKRVQNLMRLFVATY